MAQLRSQDVSSAPEGDYLATPAGPRREAATEPEFGVVSVRGRPYLLPTLAPLASAGGGNGRRRQPRGAAASEFDLHRTSATVVAELHDPDAVECVREPPPNAPKSDQSNGWPGKGKGKGKGYGKGAGKGVR